MFDPDGCRESLRRLFDDNIAGNAAPIERFEAAVQLPVPVNGGHVAVIVAAEAFDAHYSDRNLVDESVVGEMGWG